MHVTKHCIGTEITKSWPAGQMLRPKGGLSGPLLHFTKKKLKSSSRLQTYKANQASTVYCRKFKTNASNDQINTLIHHSQNLDTFKVTDLSKIFFILSVTDLYFQLVVAQIDEQLNGLFNLFEIRAKEQKLHYWLLSMQ